MNASTLTRLFVSLLAGLIFGLGLGVAQMSNPGKVQAFLDVTGDWDPSLAFVMGGAVAVTLLGFRLVRRRGQPLLDDRFHSPLLSHVDGQLILGAALFGVGWGLSGYCPGPAISTLLSVNAEVWWFVPSMLLGGWLQRAWSGRR